MNGTQPTQCPFVIAWHGACGQQPVTDRDYCHEHLGVHCANCRRQATQECGHSGQFVCGAPLCDNCEHSQYGGHGEKRYTLKEARERLDAIPPVARLEAELRDMAEHGLRCDLTPTMNCRDTSALYMHFTEYLGRLDEGIRRRAARALEAYSNG